MVFSGVFNGFIWLCRGRSVHLGLSEPGGSTLAALREQGDLGVRLVDVPQGGDVRVVEHQIDLHLLKEHLFKTILTPLFNVSSIRKLRGDGMK